MAQNYYWSPSQLSFYPVAFYSEYVLQGTFPNDAFLVDDSIYAEYGPVDPPSGSTRGVGSDNLPTWVTIDSTLTLTQAQANQILALSAACQNQIVSGFTSSAYNGISHTYPSKQVDQLNLNGSVLSAIVALDSNAWAANAAYSVGATVTYNNQAYICTTAGTSGATVPTWPSSVGNSVTDGTAVWEIWTASFWSVDANAYLPFTAWQLKQLGVDAKSYIMACLYQNNQLGLQVNAATTVAAVQAVVWVSP